MQANLFDDEEEADALESESDLLQPKEEAIRGIATFTTDWTVETILSQIDKGNILLDPKWQRRDAWNRDRKSDLIESIILNYPVPPIVLAEQKGVRGKYIVIDGKQRLLAVRQFASRGGDESFKSFRLSYLPMLPQLRGNTYHSMMDDPSLRRFVDQFENYSVRTVIVRGWEQEDILYSIFLRLNAGSAKLYPQELRQALHPGQFIDFLEEFASNSEYLRGILNNKGPDFRMRDNELALRYFAYRNFLGTYDGNLKSFLDFTVFVLNDNWDDFEGIINNQADDFGQAYEFARAVFQNAQPFRKFKRGAYESRLNRAVFDIMMFAFSSGEVRAGLYNRLDEIRWAYEDECTKNVEFVGALESTTKSVEATRTRMFVWSGRVNELLGHTVLRPQVGGVGLTDGYVG